jgi:hypothetical protein
MRLSDCAESGGLKHAFVGTSALISPADIGESERVRNDVEGVMTAWPEKAQARHMNGFLKRESLHRAWKADG